MDQLKILDNSTVNHQYFEIYDCTLSMNEEDSKKIIHSIRQYGVENYDKQLVYLAGGTLGVSLTQLDSIIKSQCTSHLWLIVVVWVLLTLSLISNLLSHRETIRTTDAWLESDDQYLKFNKRVEIMNRISLWTFLFGLSSLIIFLSINL